MARGNQRDLARAKKQKEESKKKSGNSMTGSELAKAGLSNAEIMRQKQARADAEKAAAANKELQEKRDAKAKKPTPGEEDS